MQTILVQIHVLLNRKEVDYTVTLLSLYTDIIVLRLGDKIIYLLSFNYFCFDNLLPGFNQRYCVLEVVSNRLELKT
jgi:hypothetical protein